MRLSMMLIPYSVLMRSSRYHVMYRRASSANPSTMTPVKSRLWKNSCLRRPKTPSADALSRLQPFALIERISVALADAYPFRPLVVAAAVRVGDRCLADLTPVRGVAPHAPGHGHEPCRVIRRMTRLADTTTPTPLNSRWTRLYRNGARCSRTRRARWDFHRVRGQSHDVRQSRIAQITDQHACDDQRQHHRPVHHRPERQALAAQRVHAGNQQPREHAADDEPPT